MGADNWAVCPRCFSEAQAKAQQQREEVMSGYGIVSVEEFDKARAALKDPNPEDFRTFREDFEFIGAETGTVEGDYKGHCTMCGLYAEIHASRCFWSPSETERDGGQG